MDQVTVDKAYPPHGTPEASLGIGLWVFEDIATILAVIMASSLFPVTTVPLTTA